MALYGSPEHHVLCKASNSKGGALALNTLNIFVKIFPFSAMEARILGGYNVFEQFFFCERTSHAKFHNNCNVPMVLEAYKPMLNK